ncbi:surface lipoprotein assembly modifier [Actinobacillus succinogenes]|nr:surface lipoprotein assembly modifier [Actinobacillus succinogenes]
MEAKPKSIANVEKLPETSLAIDKKTGRGGARNIHTDKNLAEYALNKAIERGHPNMIEKALKIYRTFPNLDPILVKFAEAKIAKARQDYSVAIRLFREIIAERADLNPVRIELAIVLFLDKQDSAAKAQFEKALSDESTPPDIVRLINLYLEALNKRDTWQFNVNAGYMREENVNNVSDSLYIENTAFKKGDSMLPQKAHGIQFYVGFERDFNLMYSHYLHIENLTYGKAYWDNNDYTDITNRTYLGYRHKSAKTAWSVLPFYERQWYATHRYKKATGVRGELNHWLNRNWQISTALEYGKEQYHRNALLDGNNKLASATLVWLRTPRQYFYFGGDYSFQRAQARHYGYDLKTARIGWGQEWERGISTRLGFAVSKREYKADHVLGNVFYFSKPREDDIYNINASLWKRDWHLWGITPKLRFNWKKQRSNFDSLYSYIDRSITVSVEKTF